VSANASLPGERQMQDGGAHLGADTAPALPGPKPGERGDGPERSELDADRITSAASAGVTSGAATVYARLHRSARGILGAVLELELVAVEIEEASRLAAIGRVPHLRLAFLLLDNAVEAMLRLEVQNETHLQDVNAALAQRLRSMIEIHGHKPDLVGLLANTQS